MFFNKAVIALFICTLSLSWIQAISVEEREKELTLPEDVSRLVAQNSTSELPTEENRSSNDSASKSITSTEGNSLSDEDFMTGDNVSEVICNTQDDLPEEGSGWSIDTSEDDSDDSDEAYFEEYYDDEDESSADNEFNPEDDDLDVTSPSPVTTTEDFIFEEPASTTVANGAIEKAASPDQAIPRSVIIALSVSAAVLLVILLILMKIYCVPRKATPEKDGADQTFITVDKFMTTKNKI